MGRFGFTTVCGSHARWIRHYVPASSYSLLQKRLRVRVSPDAVGLRVKHGSHGLQADHAPPAWLLLLLLLLLLPASVTLDVRVVPAKGHMRSVCVFLADVNQFVFLLCPLH